MWDRPASAQEVQGLGEHLLARLHGGEFRLVGARRTDQIDHFGHRVYVRHRDVALGVRIRMRRVVHEAVRGLVLDDPGDADAALRAAAARAEASAPANPLSPVASVTTSLRRYGPPPAVRVLWALARFSAVTSMRRRSALRALAEMSREPKRPIRTSPSPTG